MKTTKDQKVVCYFIEKAAWAAHKEFGFNPWVALGFQYFSSSFFVNTPREFSGKPWCHYFRDPETHSAYVLCMETGRIDLVEPKTFWKKEQRDYMNDWCVTPEPRKMGKKESLAKFKELMKETESKVGKITCR